MDSVTPPSWCYYFSDLQSPTITLSPGRPYPLSKHHIPTPFSLRLRGYYGHPISRAFYIPKAVTFSPASEAPNNAPVEPEILLILELALMELGHRCNATHNSLSLSKPILVLLLLTETQRSKAPQPPPCTR